MAKVGRPPKPDGEKLVRIAVSVRQSDVDALQRLALEQFLSAQSRAGIAEAHRRIFEQGERPSVSAAIRALIDAERNRRLGVGWSAWCKEFHDDKPELRTPKTSELLRWDFVWGDDSTGPGFDYEHRYAAAYASALALDRRWNEDFAHDIAAELSPEERRPATPRPKKHAKKKP